MVLCTYGKRVHLFLTSGEQFLDLIVVSVVISSQYGIFRRSKFQLSFKGIFLPSSRRTLSVCWHRLAVGSPGIPQMGDEFVGPEQRVHAEIVRLRHSLVSLIGSFGRWVPSRVK